MHIVVAIGVAGMIVVVVNHLMLRSAKERHNHGGNVGIVVWTHCRPDAIEDESRLTRRERVNKRVVHFGFQIMYREAATFNNGDSETFYCSYK